MDINLVQYHIEILSSTNSNDKQCKSMVLIDGGTIVLVDQFEYDDDYQWSIVFLVVVDEAIIVTISTIKPSISVDDANDQHMIGILQSTKNKGGIILFTPSQVLIEFSMIKELGWLSSAGNSALQPGFWDCSDQLVLK